jgi:hypothetical protein
MERTQRVGALATLVLLLGPSFAFSQTTVAGRQPAQSATVVLAVDLRELTSLRDIPHSGNVFFNRIERGHSRADGDYDLAIRYSAAAGWKSAFGGPDDNRAPHVFSIESGTYVIEKIDIGSNPTTIGPGVDPQSHSPHFGSFVVRGGEVLNLGRLVVHMHFHEGYFDAKVEDNTDEAGTALAGRNQGLRVRLQTRLMTVIPKFPFQMGPGLLEKM